MAFQLYKGNSRVEWYPKKASTVFTKDSLVLIDVNGQIDEATSSTDDHVGTILRTVTSADADYAATSSVPVLISEQDTVFLADVGTGSAAATNVGDFLDLTDALTVDVTSGTNKAAVCVGVRSATQVLVKLNSTQKNQPSA